MHRSTSAQDPLEQEKLEETRQVLGVVTDKIAVPLFISFWLLDLLYVPALKWEFLALRCLIIPTAVITHWWAKHATTYRQAEQAGLFLIFMCGSILNLMIYIMGKGSLYALALQLVAIGGLGFVPWTRAYFIGALLSVYVPYYAIELPRLTSAADYTQLTVNSFFFIGVISITWIIHAHRERFRQRELMMRNALEQEVDFRKKTEQKLIEARDRALAGTRAKDAFLANMSHEIRTPLTAIIGFAEHSLERDLSPEERKFSLRTIAGNGNHLLHIINDILDLSKIEADSIEIERSEVNPIHLAAEVQSLVMPLARKKGLDIELAYEFPLPEYVVTDSTRLKQILINICSNAIKFTDRGRITMTLAFDLQARAMIFRIMDTGIGMTTEQLENIFEPFKQADSSINRRFGGTGLGLALSRRLAVMLGGSLTADSLPDAGSEFVISIDAGVPGDVPRIHSIGQINLRAANDQVVVDEHRLQGTVLLAEDNENIQQLLSLYLIRMGMQFQVVENGEKALEKARSQHFDLILMDMQMPILSGVEAVRILRENGYDMPIVALTANATKEDRRQCMEAGCDDFITKPVKRERLYEVVARYLPPAPPESDAGGPVVSSLLEQSADFHNIVAMFVSTLPGQVSEIHDACRKQDWSALKRAVHNLKGAGGGFGYPQLSALASRIERALVDNQHESLAGMLVELDRLVHRIGYDLPARPEASARAV